MSSSGEEGGAWLRARERRAADAPDVGQQTTDDGGLPEAAGLAHFANAAQRRALQGLHGRGPEPATPAVHPRQTGGRALEASRFVAHAAAADAPVLVHDRAMARRAAAPPAARAAARTDEQAWAVQRMSMAREVEQELAALLGVAERSEEEEARVEELLSVRTEVRALARDERVRLGVRGRADAAAAHNALASERAVPADDLQAAMRMSLEVEPAGHEGEHARPSPSARVADMAGLEPGRPLGAMGWRGVSDEPWRGDGQRARGASAASWPHLDAQHEAVRQAGGSYEREPEAAWRGREASAHGAGLGSEQARRAREPTYTPSSLDEAVTNGQRKPQERVRLSADDMRGGEEALGQRIDMLRFDWPDEGEGRQLVRWLLQAVHPSFVEMAADAITPVPGWRLLAPKLMRLSESEIRALEKRWTPETCARELGVVDTSSPMGMLAFMAKLQAMARAGADGAQQWTALRLLMASPQAQDRRQPALVATRSWMLTTSSEQFLAQLTEPERALVVVAKIWGAFAPVRDALLSELAGDEGRFGMAHDFAPQRERETAEAMLMRWEEAIHVRRVLGCHRTQPSSYKLGAALREGDLRRLVLDCTLELRSKNVDESVLVGHVIRRLLTGEGLLAVQYVDNAEQQRARDVKPSKAPSDGSGAPKKSASTVAEMQVHQLEQTAVKSGQPAKRDGEQRAGEKGAGEQRRSGGPAGVGANGRSSIKCFRCGEPGHIARECTNTADQKTDRSDKVACHFCGGEHLQRHCERYIAAGKTAREERERQEASTQPESKAGGAGAGAKGVPAKAAGTTKQSAGAAGAASAAAGPSSTGSDRAKRPAPTGAEAEETSVDAIGAAQDAEDGEGAESARTQRVYIRMFMSDGNAQEQVMSNENAADEEEDGLWGFVDCGADAWVLRADMAQRVLARAANAVVENGAFGRLTVAVRAEHATYPLRRKITATLYVEDEASAGKPEGRVRVPFKVSWLVGPEELRHPCYVPRAFLFGQRLCTTEQGPIDAGDARLTIDLQNKLVERTMQGRRVTMRWYERTAGGGDGEADDTGEQGTHELELILSEMVVGLTTRGGEAGVAAEVAELNYADDGPLGAALQRARASHCATAEQAAGAEDDYSIEAFDGRVVVSVGTAGGVLTKSEMELELRTCMEEYADVFDPGVPAATSSFRAKLRVDEAKLQEVEAASVLKAKAKKYPHARAMTIRSKLDEMLHKGQLVKCPDARLAHQIILIAKPRSPGEWRLIADLSSGVNRVVLPERVVLRDVTECLVPFAGAMFYSVADCTDMYHHIRVSDDAIPYLAIVPPEHSAAPLAYTVIPQGLSTAPAIAQRISQGICERATTFGPAAAWIDDMLFAVAEPSDDEVRLEIDRAGSEGCGEGAEAMWTRAKARLAWRRTLAMLAKLAEGCRESGLKLHARKLKLLKTEVEWCGMSVSAHGISVSAEHRRAAMSLVAPKDAKDAAALLAFLAYCRHAMPGAAAISEPIASLCRKNVRFEWGDAQRDALHKLRLLLEHALRRAHPRFDRKFVLISDGSHEGLGAMLVQRGDEGRGCGRCEAGPSGTVKHDGALDEDAVIIGVASARTTEAQRAYSQFKLELAALLFAFKSFAYYLFDGDAEVDIVLDSRALLGYPFADAEASADVMQRRMIAVLQALPVRIGEVRFIEGVRNPCDVLSRAWSREAAEADVAGMAEEMATGCTGSMRTATGQLAKPRFGIDQAGTAEQEVFDEAAVVRALDELRWRVREEPATRPVGGKQEAALRSQEAQQLEVNALEVRRSTRARRPTARGLDLDDEDEFERQRVMSALRASERASEAARIEGAEAESGDEGEDIEADAQVTSDDEEQGSGTDGVAAANAAAAAEPDQRGAQPQERAGPSRDTWLDAQAHDQLAQQIVAALSFPDGEEDGRLSVQQRKWREQYAIDDTTGLLMFGRASMGARPRVFVPNSLRERALAAAHVPYHFGGAKMAQLLRAHGMHWPGMTAAATAFVEQCGTCALARSSAVHVRAEAGGPGGERPTAPWTLVAIDLSGPHQVSWTDAASVLEELGNAGEEGDTMYLLHAVCEFSSFVIVKRLARKSATCVRAALLEIFSLFGVPLRVRSDGGTEFRAEVDALFASLGVLRRRTTAYHPTGNGMAEKSVDRLKTALRSLVEERGASWIELLDEAVERVNTRPFALNENSASGDDRLRTVTPFELFFGRPTARELDLFEFDEIVPRATPLDPADARWLRRLQLQEQWAARQQNVLKGLRVSRGQSLAAGDLVMLKRAKSTISGAFSRLYSGPFVVSSCTASTATIRDASGADIVVARERLKRVRRRLGPADLAMPDTDADWTRALSEELERGYVGELDVQFEVERVVLAFERQKGSRRSSPPRPLCLFARIVSLGGSTALWVREPHQEQEPLLDHPKVARFQVCTRRDWVRVEQFIRRTGIESAMPEMNIDHMSAEVERRY